MFAELQQRTRRLDRTRIAAVCLHCLLLYLLVRPLKPIFVTPSSVAYGNYGKKEIMTPVYFAHTNETASSDDAERRIFLAKREARLRRKKLEESKKEQEKEAAAQADRAGTPYGSVLQGPMDGHDVRPALPVVFPDPVVRRSELPDGVAGTVIVEITIDQIGNVIATKVLQPLGYGIEDRVIAVLRNWRFRPATMDGRPIPSQQDVYFRFPS